MKVLIDTNIIIDVLAKREPFLTDSAKVLRLSEEERIDYIITRNPSDFNQSPVPALTPEEFLRNFE